MNDSRKYIIRILILIIAIVFSTKLFFIQVLDESYQLAAENNIVQEIVEYPYRGLIFDRNKELLVYNEPSYDLIVVPKEVRNLDTAMFCQTFGIDHNEFIKLINKAKSYSPIKPSQFIKQISNESFAIVQDRLINFQGFYPKARTVRKYPHHGMANAFGYISEVDSKQLKKDTSNYYKSGDYIGKTGIEASYENALRGKRGVKYKMVNVRGIEKGAFKEGKLDTLAVPGENITLTIDIELQRYAEKLMFGKVGSVVAIEPTTGEILAFVSSPSYDPNLLSGRNYSENYGKILTDSLRPLFNRPLMAMYPPGSIFKIVQGLVALEEGVVTADEQIYCDNTLIGDHAPIGSYDMRKAVTYSSNNYFYKIFRRLISRDAAGDAKSQFRQAPIGLTRWKEMVSQFGLGAPLGVDIPDEGSGSIPGPELYDRIYRGKGTWKFSNIYSLSIGQGEITLNPIQIANLAAIMANRGYYYIPHITKGIGQTNYLDPKYKEKISLDIKSEHFEVIVDGMEEVVNATAQRARIADIIICGKTGTVQKLHGEDNSTFMAFAPKENPQIAISVYVENVGWGGRAAGSIASLLIEKKVRGYISPARKWTEEFVLKGNFLF
ncbi:MAG: penicillin-binding protein 2 [Cyclobacteriaceae bacterium]|jgi:penicillin-binding protein 2|nr:penicillin-binding protein 2 [Cyclobacteriaceae bacterium]